MTNTEHKPNKASKIILFWSIYLLVLFSSKEVLHHVSIDNNGAFLLKNLGTFICALLATGAVLRYLPNFVNIFIILSILAIVVLLLS
jgi:hypothetical protein